MSHISVAYFPQCHMSNSRNDYVPFYYIFSPHVSCHYVLCRMSNLRNAHVALSILGVKVHHTTCRYADHILATHMTQHWPVG